MILNPTVPVSPSNGPRIDDFAAATAESEVIYVSASGQSMRVRGTGATPSGRSVAWVAPDIDTVSLFASALARTYGQGIATAIAREVGLEPSPGKPLSSRTVERAVDMAKTAGQALSGVDFMTAMNCSAVSGAPLFRSVCQSLDITPAALDARLRQQIDTVMQQHFALVGLKGQSPVSEETAQTWLRDVLRSYVDPSGTP